MTEVAGIEGTEGVGAFRQFDGGRGIAVVGIGLEGADEGVVFKEVDVGQGCDRRLALSGVGDDTELWLDDGVADERSDSCSLQLTRHTKPMTAATEQTNKFFIMLHFK